MSDEALTALREAAARAIYGNAGGCFHAAHLRWQYGDEDYCAMCDADAVLAAVLPLVVEQIAQRIDNAAAYDDELPGMGAAAELVRSYAREALPAAEETR